MVLYRRRGELVDRAERKRWLRRHDRGHAADAVSRLDLAGPRKVGRGVVTCLNLAPLAGEVGLRSDPGEGVQVYTTPSALAERAPHPNPLPARAGRGSITH
jgi:hypothetical protein